MHCHCLLLLVALLPVPAFALDHADAELEMAQAISAVQAAQRDDAPRYAPADFDEARLMVETARRAADSRDWIGVATYAERAKVAGDLASAKAREQRAESATAEIRRSLDALRARFSTSGE